jgi:hypothetical protein
MQATLSCRATTLPFGVISEQIGYDSYLAEHMTGMEKIPRGVITWVSILILLSLASSCSTKKTTGPVEPTVYVMKDYFPLNDGDEWIWEVAVFSDSVPEPYVDGDINEGEPFRDDDKNGVYDQGEPFVDINGNGDYDGPDDPWAPGFPYQDRNMNGEYDPPNGEWDEGEFFADLDTNGVWNWIQSLRTGRLKGGIGGATSVSSDGSVIFCRRSRFVGSGGVFVDRYTDDGFSNDSLGLRWHSHSDGWFFSRQDDLKDHAPITIAGARIKVGDSVVNVDTSYLQDEISGIYTWISILEGVEDATVPAGDFSNCLKFRTFASGWEGNMARYNGNGYQWYATGVGLVKSEGPEGNEFWQLESAIINGQSYP